MVVDAESSLVVWLVNQGVAVAVVGFVLWRLERRLVEVHDAIDRLTLALVRVGAINGTGGPIVGAPPKVPNGQEGG